MKNMMKIALISLASFSTVAMANHHENCEVEGKKIHVKNKAACTKQKGTFMEPKKEMKATEVKAPEATAPAAAPAAEQKASEAPKK
jgi:hypothetical protein